MVARFGRFGLGPVLTTSIVASAGAAFGWNGLVANLGAWHTSRRGLNGSPTDKLVIDGLVVRGDKSLFESPIENPAGVWLSNYAAKTIVVRNADAQGTETGVSSQRPGIAGWICN
jgi:hypothetical protein